MSSTVFEAQKPLRKKYREDPATAMVTDHARTSGQPASAPFHSNVEPMDGCGVVVPIGVHAGLGGLHHAPTPGDMLCAALASCQDSTIRMIANLLEVELLELEVRVTATVDLRGTMAIDPAVPVGFQGMRCDVRMRVKEGTPARLVERLQQTAERCCVVLQTLKAPPPITLQFTT